MSENGSAFDQPLVKGESEWILRIALECLIIILNRFLVLSGQRIRAPAPRIFRLVSRILFDGRRVIGYRGVVILQVPIGERTQALNAAASVPGLIDFKEPKPQYKNFAPRLGFAYSPGNSGNTSIRGGYGMSYDVLYDNLGTLSFPPQFSGTQDVDTTTSTPNFLATGGLPPGSGGIQTFPTVAAQRAATAGLAPLRPGP